MPPSTNFARDTKSRAAAIGAHRRAHCSQQPSASLRPAQQFACKSWPSSAYWLRNILRTTAPSGRATCAAHRATSALPRALKRAGTEGGAPPHTAAAGSNDKKDFLSQGNRHFTVGGGRLRQSGPRPEGRLLRQPALEGLTRSARTDSPRKVGRNNFRRSEAATAAAQGGGGGGLLREERAAATRVVEYVD
ncbi:scarecrow-like protein 3-like [Dorcoceras hygrometricum]|uniref:Scarecrow-like protein 3-like n=1 Tax=Dorcoceras hygrometricum TaxID=472368 RepID=A0A2Z7APY1_9LAMI|nr:scarecrow-like protein 3-like [Dorcoceras hygrometricum]